MQGLFNGHKQPIVICKTLIYNQINKFTIYLKKISHAVIFGCSKTIYK